MPFDALPELGSVGILTFLLVELGKRVFPGVFQSDNNVFLSIVIATLINGLYVFFTGGDVWASIPTGATTGLAVSGLYRGISLAAKRNNIDLTEIVEVPVTDAVSNEAIEVGEDGMKIVRGFVGTKR